jgi:hypothetical protein
MSHIRTHASDTSVDPGQQVSSKGYRYGSLHHSGALHVAASARERSYQLPDHVEGLVLPQGAARFAKQ